MGHHEQRNPRQKTRHAAFPGATRPSRIVRQFEWEGEGCAATIITTGLLLTVEIIHSTSGKNYARLARSTSELKSLTDLANMHALSLGMELVTEVDI